MMYYFKNAAQGVTSDGTPLPPALWQNPFVAVMNAMSYNGMVLGNHEFNFGAPVFDSTFSQAGFPHPGRQYDGLRRIRDQQGRSGSSGSERSGREGQRA